MERTENPISLTSRGPLDESAWARLEHVLSLLDRGMKGAREHRRTVAQRILEQDTVHTGQLERAQAIEAAFRACRAAILGDPETLAEWANLA